MKTMMRFCHFILVLLAAEFSLSAQVTKYVDPKIGSEGLGRTVIAPSCPFGMVKPSPDCTVSPNSGWLPMPVRVDGFGQVHVSGTGGGPKYGNILIMPFSGALEGRYHYAYRESENIAIGEYSCTFAGSGINVEITTAQRASFYRIGYPEGSRPALSVDAGFFLGESPEPNAREAQEFEDSFAEVVSECEIRGWSRIRGGWNNGAPYTVYFHLVTDSPFRNSVKWEENGREGILVGFDKDCRTLNVKLGISFLSMEKARLNVEEQISGWSFEQVRGECVSKWEDLLGRIKVSGTEKQKRMFYTGLYHTMLMPVDRTGEWEKCDPEESYYDDFYAIWDTYRSSNPLFTILDPQREVEIVNALLNIYKNDGFLPDARSGNSNGRTQGGSNAEIMIADAFVKGLEGIDYELALEAMINDAETVPADDEAEGRGGLLEYNRLGFIPWGIDRAGNRTVEYAMCDYAIYTVAKGLGYDEIAEKYLERSSNWKNLWRDDTECDGVRGFIMPRSANGEWLDELPFGHSALNRPSYSYTTTMFEGPWYTKWWSSFFYEASSWEYSLSVPHDVPGLIEACGGEEDFEKRLDRFFEGGYYNVNNEPSFLTPCLYHWIGKPEKTSTRVRQIISDHFSDSPDGLPGNDDSGAMSSWLAFHMLGLYPVAGDTTYVIHTPIFKKSKINLPDGRTLKIVAKGMRGDNLSVSSIRLNGKRHPAHFLSHRELMNGGRLVLRLKKAIPAAKAEEMPVRQLSKGGAAAITDTLLFSYKLHGQTRRFSVWFDMPGDSLRMNWTIERNLKLWRGSYTMSPNALENAEMISSRMPEDGNHLTLADDELFNLLSRKAYDSIKSTGACRFNNTEFRMLDSDGIALDYPLLHLKDVNEGMEMWVLDCPVMPIIWEMRDNPLELNWTCRTTDIQRNEVLSDVNKAGGIYYRYPVSRTNEETAPPRGYKPFYISHYGRHGSRYLTDDRRYKDVLDFFEKQQAEGNLTATGKELLVKLRTLWPEVEGKGGELSSLGAEQHKNIAERMAERYPEVFVRGKEVNAASSVNSRCIASMDAFCGALQNCFPEISISKDSSPDNMTWIACTSQKAEAVGSERNSFWADEFSRFEHANIHPQRLLSSLFKRSERIPGMLLFDALFWIAEGQQNIPSDIDFFCYFTPEELFGKWRTVNFRMYLANCNAPLTEGAGAQSAYSLLTDILNKASESVAGAGSAADLRFGHDTNLIRLLALMRVRECAASEDNPEHFWRSWKDWAVSPMAANLQMVFYRSSKDNDPVLVKFLLNEKETVLDADLKPVFWPYYKWSDLYEYLSFVQKQAEKEQ